MARLALIALVLASVTVGCTQSGPRVVWIEGEAYAAGPRNATEGIGAKPPASGGAALYGAVLSSVGGYARYDVEIPADIVDARMLIRYSRYHWRPMDAAQVAVTLTQKDRGVARTAVMDNTGGWGSRNKADWGLAAVELGTLAAGQWTVRFSAIADEHGDVNIDGFFLVAGAEAITADELNAADRIDITGDRYLGVSIATTIINQRTMGGFELPARGFEPMALDVTVSVLDESGVEVAVLEDASDLPINDDARTVLVSGAPVRKLPDGAYTVRAAWETAPAMDVPIFLVGDLSAGYDERFKAIAAFSEKLSASSDPDHAAYAADYTYAVAFLTDAWKKVGNGAADKSMLASIRRVLSQYETTTELIETGRPAYARRTGDLRLAFVSEATGRLEEYRLFLPDTYNPAGEIPLLMALNHNVRAYLDQADGTTKRVANARGYAILAPGAVGTDEETADYQGDGEKDMLQLLTMILDKYPGLDRSRVYCTGTSRGGFGTYSFATAHPELFAAIACASGVGNWDWGDEQRTLAERFAPMPTLILHGEIDNLVPAEMASAVAARLDELGIAHELHIFPSYGHSYENYCEQYLTMTLDYFEKVLAAEAAPAEEAAEGAQAEEPAETVEAPTVDVVPAETPSEPAAPPEQPQAPEAEQAPAETPSEPAAPAEQPQATEAEQAPAETPAEPGSLPEPEPAAPPVT